MMGGMKLLNSRLQFELFALAFLVSIGIMWFTVIWQKNYVVFTDPESVPEPTDFLAELPAYIEELWTR